MSCLTLVDSTIRDVLRNKIANNLVAKANNNEAINLADYVREVYDLFKKKGATETLAIDAARIVPILLDQIVALKPEIAASLKQANPRIRYEILELSEKFEENVEAVRELLGLKETPAPIIEAVQQEIIKAQTEVAPQTAIKFNPIAHGAFRSFGVEVINYENPDKPGYMEPKPEFKHAFTVMRALDEALQQQITAKGISDSSNMTYPGVEGGIYLMAKAAPYEGIAIVVTDKNGIPIKFDSTGKADAAGQSVSYSVTTDPLRNSSGEIITDEKEFSKYKEKLTNPGARAAANGAFSNIQIAIAKFIELKNPQNAKLSPEQQEKAHDEAVKSIRAEYNLQKKMRTYLNKNQGSFIMAAINGGSKGIVNKNVWTQTDLSAIDFTTSNFYPIVETKEQAEGSILRPGNVYFKYPGIDEPVIAVGKAFVDRPELLAKVVSLFSGDLFTNATGKTVRLSIEERNRLIEQYLFTSEIKYLSNEVGGGRRNWINSDGTFTLKVGSQEFKIKFDDSPESKVLQEKAAEAVKAELSKPWIQADAKGFPIDKSLNSKTKIEIARQQGANIVYAKEGQSFDEAVAEGTITPGSIFVVMRPNAKGGTDVDNAFRVYYPSINANNNNLNKDYEDISFVQEGGKTLISKQSESYNDYVLKNFSTPAATVDGKIRTVNSFIAFAPIPTELTKFVAGNKKADPVQINETYKGKILFATPGSGKSTVAGTTEDVIDADDLLLDEIARLYPEFPIDKSLHPGKILYSFFQYPKAKPEEVYENVRTKMKELTAQGKTIVTGSVRFIPMADYVFTQTNPEILKTRPGYNTQSELLAAKGSNKTVIPISDYMDKVLTTAPDAIKVEAPVVKPAETIEQKNAPLTQKNVSELSREEKMKALLNKKLDKGAKAKAANARATNEQMKAAEEWYAKSPLSVPFPFRVMYAAINSSTGGPAAQWAIHGVTLFHYFSPDGKFDPAVSGDYTDLYHEAWHGFTQTFLTEEQRSALYAEARKKGGSFVDFKGKYVTFKDANWEQLEEYMAEEFRAYAISGGKLRTTSAPVKNSIFRKILDFLKQLFSKSKTSDVIENPLGNPNIHNLYEKLYTGNLAEYNFDVNNRDKTIGALDHALLATDPKSPIMELGYDDANLLVNSIDSIISSVVNQLNADRTDADMTSRFSRDPELVKFAYGLVRDTLREDIIPALRKKADAAKNDFEKNLIEQDIRLVQWAIDNFGDVDNLGSNKRSGKGMIAYHLEKSKYLTKEDKEALTDDDINETKQILVANDLHSQSGNEKSQLEMSAPEVQQLLRSIHKYDEKGKPSFNRLGIQELTDHHQMVNKLARVLGDSTTQGIMYDKLFAAANKDGSTYDPTLADVLAKLGPPNTDSAISKNLWINFWSTFNMANIKLLQMNIEHTDKNYHVTIGGANTYSHKVGNFWRNIFLTQPNSRFIKRDPDNNNYLDLVDVINNFSDGDRLKKDSEFEFFRALGVNLSDKSIIREAVTLKGGNTGAAAQIFRRLKRLVNERNTLKLRSLDDVFKEYPADGKLEAIVNENTHYNALKELEAKNSDYANNYMVTNAEGNTQFEQSLHNTISIMVANLNGVESYAQLMTIPHMKYLDIETNSFAAASVWLNSLFDMRNYVKGDPTKTGLKRRAAGLTGAEVKINMSNLSGIQLIDENGDQGVSSAGSDEFSKLIMDFHLNTMAARPELMRHADKGTSFSIWLSNINGGSSDNRSYVDTIRLIKNQDGHVAGYDKAIQILERYVDAELQRIKKLEALSKEENLVYDANYLKEGQNFVIFEGILSPKIKSALLKYNTLDEALKADPELGSKIKQEIVNYFEAQTSEVKTLMNKAKFIDKGLITKTAIEANRASVSAKTINNADVEDGLVRSFVVNSWIHNLESMSMIYGDLAQYNMAKEEFHKRNAGAGSTGKLFASDVDTINYVNNKGRLYAKSLGLAEKQLSPTGEFDSAILADNEIPSVSYDIYHDAIKESMVKKNNNISDPKKRLSAEEIDKKALAAAKAYTENNEGDAQGWITFDFYRSLSILEGKWSSKQEKMYNEIIAGRPIDGNVTEFFPTRKFQYWGPVVVKEGQPPLNAFHKFSLFPMIPSIVGDNNMYKDRLTNLGLLQQKMITEQIDYALFKSGSKISTLTKITDGKSVQDKFYSDDKEHTFESKGLFTKNTIFLQFLKDQLEIAPYFKERVTFPTQMRKLIENGLMEGGVPTDFMVGQPLPDRQKAWEKLPEDQRLISKRYQKVKEYEKDIDDLTQLRKKELEQEADIKRDSDGNILMNDKLAAFLVGELKRQDLGEHEIAFLKQINGKLSKDLSLSLSAEKIEKVLNSIVVRRLIKQQFNGEGLIQVSGAGFESALRGKLTAEEQAKYGTNGLSFYRRGKDGKTQAMKVKIALQGDFKNLLYLNHIDGKPIETRERLNEMLKNEAWLDQENHRKMISIIGPRIPVQGLNSMEFAEVYEFLPIEAGNIVVLPTEIVAKAGSDFDIDKLTFLMPNISSGVNYEYWATAAGKAKLADLRRLNPDVAAELSDENVASIILNRKDKDKSELDKAILTTLAENSQKNVSYVTGKSAEALENKILDNMRSILELEENFVDLIRPNGTDIVKEGLADELAQYTMEFDPRTATYTDKKGKEAKRIPGNRVFEIRYNLYKHASNNIGKQTLGLGAVDNTYNSLFNRIGARMNNTYMNRGVVKRLDILLQHNTLKDNDGNDVISLSHLMDAKGENSIADVISQLMNGWVDIAKDAWIFNIQGNKEVAPVLLFMVQAGVPIKQAVYMAANPMIRAYVTEQKLARSTFAGPLGKSPGNWRFYRSQARKIILGSPKYGINLSEEALTNANKLEDALNSTTLELTDKVKDFFSPDKVEENLLGRVKEYSKLQKSGELKEAEFYTDEDRAVFLHYIELEEMSKSLTGIKTKTNVDTSRSNTLFEAQSRLEMIEELKADGKFPEWMITKLIGDPDKGIKGESPIASFNVQGFQIKLWKDFFKLRNDSRVNNFILDKMREKDFSSVVENTWGESEKLVNQFRNGLVPFVFQNYMRNFDIDNPFLTYKGVDVDSNYTIASTPSLKHGVFVKNENGKRVFYVDKIQLKKDFQTLGTKKFTGFAGAQLWPAAFKTAGSYYSFVFERELLRSMYPGAQGWKVLQERGDVQANLAAHKEKTPDKTQGEIEAIVYEETLRDMALDNTYNMWKLFKSRTSMADQLVQIQLMYPGLASQYAVVNNMAPSIRQTGPERTANIMLTDIMMDADKVNLFNQNLRELSDPSKIKLSTDNAQEIQRVAEFFKKLSVYAFLQSGMTTTGMFSLVRVVPQERFTGQMIPYAANFTQNLNDLTLQRYWNVFIQNSTDKRLRSRLRDYSISDFNPQRDAALARGKDMKELRKIAANELVDRDRFATDNSGNTLYYANPSLNQDGVPVNGLLQSEAKELVKNNPERVFVMNGATESMIGGNKDEKALINAKDEVGNVIPFPTKKSFAFKGYELKDVPAEEAAAIQEQTVEPVQETIEPAFKIDQFKYYGQFYDIKVDLYDNWPVEVIGYKGPEHKAKLILNAYYVNPNVDPQNKKAFRTAPKLEKPVVAKKTVVPKGSKATNLPIFQTEDKIFLMNDGQQAAYDHIKAFVLDRLTKTVGGSTTEHVAFNSPMTAEFSGVIPQAMWDNMVGLVGRGGVGKTTVIKKVLDDVRAEFNKGSRYGSVNISYAAPTHNAVTMLQEAIGLDSEKTEGVQTLAGMVARNQTFSSKDKEPTDTGSGEDGLFLLNEDAYKKRLNFVPAISDADIIVIDESSMVDTQFIKDLMFRFKTEGEARGVRKMPVFIYMGDYRQLPPVDTKKGEKKPFREGIISATLFSDKNKNKFSELTQVMRSDNELFHHVFDSVGDQITEQRKDVDSGKTAKDFDFTEYDALTNESTENMLIVQENQVDAMIEDYAEVLATTDDPYAMYWTHYNNIANVRTEVIFNKIRAAYFKRIGVPMPTGTYKGKDGKTRHEIGVGDYVQSTFTLPVDTKNDPELGIGKGIVKPTARFKVLDIIDTEMPLSELNSDLYRYLGTNVQIKVKKIVLFNRQGKKRLITFPTVRGSVGTVGYDARTKSQNITITDKNGTVHPIAVPYSKWKEIMNDVLQLNQTFEDMFLPSYIGSTHTVQGASIKKIIVGDYNIRLNAPNIALRDMESSLYTAITRTAEKLIIIKPNFVPIKNNQEVFQLQTVEGAPQTIEDAKEVVEEGAPKTVVSTSNPAEYTNYSGAAQGADTEWAKAGKEVGIGKQVDYTPQQLQQLTAEQRIEVENAYQKAVIDLGRRPLPYNWNNPQKEDYSGGLVRRDYLQAKAADAVFAVGALVAPGQKDKKGYINKTDKTIVEGGTGYAVQMAINLGKPVYVFDQIKDAWYEWTGSIFRQTFAPKLTPKFAGIGTREINDAGKKAIKNVYSNTFKEQLSTGVTTKSVEPTTLPLINGATVDPRIKAQIDATIQSMLNYQNDGYDLAFPGTGLGQYMIGADDLTGILDPTKTPVAKATFVYLSEQLFKHFKYVNPNFEKALYDQGSINVVQKDSPITDEEVQQQLDFFDKTCGG